MPTRGHLVLDLPDQVLVDRNPFLLFDRQSKSVEKFTTQLLCITSGDIIQKGSVLL